MLMTIVARPKNTHGLNRIEKVFETTASGVSSKRSMLVMPFLSIIWERKLVRTVNRISGMKRVTERAS